MKIPLSSFFWVHLPLESLFWRRVWSLFLLLYLSSTTVLFAQNKIWDKTIGGDRDDQLKAMQQSNDGGYILGGTSYSGISGDKTQANKGEKDENGYYNSDYWIVKLKADGSKEWDKTYGSFGSENLAFLQQTRDGGYILGGTSYAGKSGDKTESNKGPLSEDGYYSPDYWIVKLKADGSKEWDKTIGGSYDDVLASMQQTTDGGYILGGTSYSGKSGDKSEDNKNGWYDYWVVKLKADGSKEWDNTIGGDNSDDLASVKQTQDGGYILGGYSYSDKGGDKTEDSRNLSLDYWVVKLKSNGSKEWDKTIGGDNDELLTSIQMTLDGGYILGGSSISNISGDKTEASKSVDCYGYYDCPHDYWIVKLKSDGSKEWDRTLGGKENDDLMVVQQTKEGGYVLGGKSSSGISGDKSEGSKDNAGDYNPGDYWIVKLNNSGKKEWDKTIGGSWEDILASVQQTSDGGYILGGTSYSDKSGDKSENSRNGWPDYWIVKLDNKGTNLPQIITFEPIINRNLGDAPFKLSATASSGLPVSFSIVAGPATIKNNILTVKGKGIIKVKAFQAGNNTYKPAEVTQSFLAEASIVQKQWDKTFGGKGQDHLRAMWQTPDGGYILGGISASGINGDKSEANKGGYDYWIVKLNAQGTKEWDKTIGGNAGDELTKLQLTSDGGYILGGYSSSGIGGDKSEANRGSESADYWVIKLDAQGKKQWDKTYGSSSYDYLTAVQQTQDGGYILGGNSYSNKSGDKTENSKGGDDYWVVKIREDGSKEWDKTFGGDGGDLLNAVQQTSDGGYILGGHSTSGINGDKTDDRGFEEEEDSDYWIIKIDSKGTKQWDKTFGSNYNDYCTSLQLTHDGGYILSGWTQSVGISGDKTEASKGDVDYWVIKLNALGLKEWNKTVGSRDWDYFGTVQQTQDGGYILGGASPSGIGGDKSEINKGKVNEFNEPTTDYWIVKLKADGSKDWDKTIGGISSDELTTLQQTQDGGYMLGGSTSSGKGGDKSEVSQDAINADRFSSGDYWIVKLSAEQPFMAQWNMRYGGSNTDNLTSVIKTQDGSYLAGGYSDSDNSGDKSQNSQGKNDYWIVKSDKNGKKLWDKRFGGSQDDFLNSVIQTQDGGYLLAGSSVSGKSGDKTESSRGNRDYWIIKTDKNGNQQWDKSFGGSGYDELKKVIQLASGEYVLGGYSHSPLNGDKTQASQGGSDYWILKISSNGTVIWDKRYGGDKNEILSSFTQTLDEGFLLGGNSVSGITGDKAEPNLGASDYWIVKTDKNGNLLWEKTFGGSGTDEVYSVRQSSGGNLFLAGTSDSGKSGSKSQNNKGGKDYWLVQLDKNGDKLWDKTYGGNQDDELRASTFTEQGHCILAGFSYSGVSGDKTQAAQGESDYWLVAVNEQGDRVQDQSFGGSGREELRTVTQTREGGLLLGGRSDSGVSGNKSQPSQGSTDYWLVQVVPISGNSKLATRTATQTTVPVVVNELAPLTAYPNPFQELLTISFTLPQTQTVNLKIYDNQGKEIKSLFHGEAQGHQTYQLEWQAGNLAAGMYLLQLQTPTKHYHQKLLLRK